MCQVFVDLIFGIIIVANARPSVGDGAVGCVCVGGGGGGGGGAVGRCVCGGCVFFLVFW